MNSLICVCLVLLLFVSPNFGEDDCTLTIQSLNLVPNVNPDKVFLIQHINGQQPIKHSLKDSQCSIANSPKFDKTKTMYIVVPGEIPSYSSTDIKNLIKALKAKNLKNIFELDWTLYSNTLNYPRSVVNAKKIGELLGTTLEQLDKTGVYGYHLITHSLGAHLSGFAGKQFFSLSSDKLDRITALDPTRLCFAKEAEDERLTSSDSFFVDVIHTSAKRGMSKAIGDADFHPNGGYNMPGKLDNHLAGIKYFIESINNDNFVAVNCKDWKTFKCGACKNNTPQVKMGFSIDTTKKGVFYLRTEGSSPYSMGTSGLE